MQYFGAYRFIFESPRWATHLLIGAVCQLVPIVGQLVLMGYIYNVLETKHRYGHDQFPPFDFNRLSVYLVRGLWPFIVSVVAALPLVLLIGPFILIAVLSGIATGQNDNPPWFTIGLFAVGIPLFVVFLFALRVVDRAHDPASRVFPGFGIRVLDDVCPGFPEPGMEGIAPVDPVFDGHRSIGGAGRASLVLCRRLRRGRAAALCPIPLSLSAL